MNDQATILRDLVERSSKRANEREIRQSPVKLVFTSAKGGVGTSHLALNTAIGLGELGKSVLLLDFNLGLSSLELLSGHNSYINLAHYLAGIRGLQEVVLPITPNVTLLSGTDSYFDCTQEQAFRFRDELLNFERTFDFVVCDVPARVGIGMAACQAGDRIYLVTTTETTSLADTYSWLKSKSRTEIPSRVGIVVNRVNEESTGESIYDRLKSTTRKFLGSDLQAACWVPEDQSVPQATRSRNPLLLWAPTAPAATAIRQWLRKVDQTILGSEESFFERLEKHWKRRAG